MSPLLEYLRRAVLSPETARRTDGQLLESFLTLRDEVAELTQGVLKALLLTRLKPGLGVVLLGAALAGEGLLACQAPAADLPDAERSKGPLPAALGGGRPEGAAEGPRPLTDPQGDPLPDGA